MVLEPDTPECRKKLNALAREQLKSRILLDVLIDLNVCRIEGWDGMEFIDELIKMLLTVKDEFHNKGGLAQ